MFVLFSAAAVSSSWKFLFCGSCGLLMVILVVRCGSCGQIEEILSLIEHLFIFGAFEITAHIYSIIESHGDRYAIMMFLIAAKVPFKKHGRLVVVFPIDFSKMSLSFQNMNQNSHLALGQRDTEPFDYSILMNPFLRYFLFKAILTQLT